jgi:phosphoadenosine phosphosulfate reductase
MCTKCGICVRTCPTGAIKVEGGIQVDEKLCTKCGACAESCVVAHYFDKLAGDLGKLKQKEKAGRRRKG